MSKPLSILCIASFFKGENFMISAKKNGAIVYLVTSKKLEDKNWPKEYIDEIFYVQQDDKNNWNMDDVISGLSYVMRNKKIDRIVSLDDFDVEKGALLREHFRIPGMGQTTARYFRDKLAMRVKAHDSGIAVPAFTGLFHDDAIKEFTEKVSAPWLVKPRAEASATGIKKINNATELWDHLCHLGDKRHEFLLEQFKPGDVFHIDALSEEGKIVFMRTSQYVNPPFDVAHGGGIFRSVVCEFNGKDDKNLQRVTNKVMKAFGMQYSASHTEVIKCHEDGNYYFLETSCRVGGAHLADMVEGSSGLNLWEEWAKLELSVARGEKYELPNISNLYAGIIVSLSKEKYPNYDSYQDSEIWWKMKDNEYHIGLIVRSDDRNRILELLDAYAKKIFNETHATAPAPDRPKH